MKKSIIIGLFLLIVVLVSSCIVFFRPQELNLTPTIYIEKPQKMDASSGKTFTLDVFVSSLGEAYYPAMSASISFDSSRLEFLGIDEGNVFVRDDDNSSGRKIPEWSCNVERCNSSGVIRVMYLDMSGGEKSFEQRFLSDNGNVLFRLKFRLRGSVRSGDVIDLIVEDAVFAAFDEAFSLASNTGTLDVKNSRIVIGE